MIEERLGARTAVIAIPIGSEHAFKGMVDLVSEKAFIWNKDDLLSNYDIVEIPLEIKDEAIKWREKLIERVAETDDTLMDKFINNKPISAIEIKNALRKATIAYKLVPVYCGTSLRNKGVQPLLDAVVDYLPSPLDLPEVSGVNEKGEKVIRKADINDPFTALAFKIQLDPHVGKLTYIRVYSGKIDSGSYIYNSSKRKQERLGRILLMHADHREELKTAYAGEIVAAVGLKDTGTGDTLTLENNPVLLESISFPEPVISLAIEPKTKADQEKMGVALHRLADEDPTFKISANIETGQTIIWGMGELHLEVLVDRMFREFKVQANVGAPQVAYKETIQKPAQAEGKYIRQSGGRGQYGHCYLKIEPKTRSEGFEFINAIKGAAIPAEFIPAIEKGVIEAMKNGVLAGYPLVDIKVTLYDGTFHDVDSSEIAFKIAGSQALQKAVREAMPILIEPIMNVEVTTPEDFMGTIIGDLSAKRGQILETETRGVIRIIKALVPLSELSGYATVLRSVSQGRAAYYMEPSHYAQVPKNIQEKIVSGKN